MYIIGRVSKKAQTRCSNYLFIEKRLIQYHDGEKMWNQHDSITRFHEFFCENVFKAEYPAKSLDKRCLFFNKAFKKWPILIKNGPKKAKNGNFLT